MYRVLLGKLYQRSTFDIYAAKLAHFDVQKDIYQISLES